MDATNDPQPSPKKRRSGLTPEGRARVAAAMRARWANPRARRKLTAQLKAALADPVVNAKRLAALRVSIAQYHEKRAAALRAEAAAGLDEVSV